MRDPAFFDKIDLHLIRVLHTVLTEQSVSRAAVRLGMHQPAVSAALKRLRALAGDPLLVRSGAGMVPTEAGARMVQPAGHLLETAQQLFGDVRGFLPRTSERTFRLAASDALDPLFLPRLVARLKSLAPFCRIEIHPLSADAHYHDHLARGEWDLVVGNWSDPPQALHRAPLFADEVVCLVAQTHPAVRQAWSLEQWLAADHVAPTPSHPGGRGVIDEHLDALGLSRRIGVRCAHFSLIPSMVAASALVLTTGRHFCERFTAVEPVCIVPCPVEFPVLQYGQLWHERTHASPAHGWLREQVKWVASSLRPAGIDRQSGA